jgi:CheY-like chemotaxis protein
MTSPKHILVVNDTQEILELFRAILEEEGGYKVTLTSIKPQMLDMVKDIKPDLIISDHVFGDEKVGWQFIQRIKMDRETAGIPLIVCSGAIKELREMEGYLTSKDIGVLYKPFDVDELLLLVATKLETHDKNSTYHGDGVDTKERPRESNRTTSNT